MKTVLELKAHLETFYDKWSPRPTSIQLPPEQFYALKADAKEMLDLYFHELPKNAPFKVMGVLISLNSEPYVSGESYQAKQKRMAGERAKANKQVMSNYKIRPKGKK